MNKPLKIILIILGIILAIGIIVIATLYFVMHQFQQKFAGMSGQYPTPAASQGIPPQKSPSPTSQRGAGAAGESPQELPQGSPSPGAGQDLCGPMKSIPDCSYMPNEQMKKMCQDCKAGKTPDISGFGQGAMPGSYR